MKELFHLFLESHLNLGKVFLGLLEYGLELRHNYIGTLSEALHPIPQNAHIHLVQRFSSSGAHPCESKDRQLPIMTGNDLQARATCDQ